MLCLPISSFLSNEAALFSLWRDWVPTQLKLCLDKNAARWDLAKCLDDMKENMKELSEHLWRKILRTSFRLKKNNIISISQDSSTRGSLLCNPPGSNTVLHFFYMMPKHPLASWHPNTLLLRALEKAEEPEIKLPTSPGSSKRQEFQKKSISSLLTMPKPLTVWITINCGKFWKRWEYQTT